MPRFFCPAPLHSGDLIDLPAGAARHVQVLRLIEKVEGIEMQSAYAFGRV